MVDLKQLKKPRILILCDYYLPGFQSGGGMRTLVNTVKRLNDRFDFHIVTRDHDGPFDRKPYDTVRINEWNQVSGANVFYLSPRNVRMKVFRKLIREINPDAIYTNSYFSTPTICLLLLRKLRLIASVEIILAPCGELAPSALRGKSLKKKVFLAATGVLGLYNGLIWKASTDTERDEIDQSGAKNPHIFVAPDLPASAMTKSAGEIRPPKTVGHARFIMLARVVPVKNFKWLIPLLGNVRGDLAIDICGPIEDAVYWHECEELIGSLPSNVVVRAIGPVPNEEAVATLSRYHFFLLPSLGENFGHVIPEALAAGCPLVISDRTPWIDLSAKGVGWEIPLEAPDQWLQVLDLCLEMAQPDYTAMSERAKAFIAEWLADASIEQKTVDVLDFAVRDHEAG